MQLLAEESGLCDTVDPLAGSYYVETMTNQMRRRMEEIIAEVDAQGGIIKQVSEGAIQSRVSARAYDTQRKILSGEIRKVGVNCYQIEEEDEHEPEYHPYDEVATQKQIDSMNAVKSERNPEDVERTLAKVKDDAKAGINVMPAIMDAVKAYATVGEITKKLTEVYGGYQEPIRF
jgi:methylmalonyl-CoA mutase N-terminal domain/subunit